MGNDVCFKVGSGFEKTDEDGFVVWLSAVVGRGEARLMMVG